jgi:hypothetical protein
VGGSSGSLGGTGRTKGVMMGVGVKVVPEVGWPADEPCCPAVRLPRERGNVMVILDYDLVCISLECGIRERDSDDLRTPNVDGRSQSVVADPNHALAA